MPVARANLGIGLLLAVFLAPRAADGQAGNPKDAIVDTIRTRTDIGQSDQEHLAAWVQAEIDGFTDAGSFRKRFLDLWGKAGNTDAFKLQFASQASHVAASAFAKSGTKPDVAYALAQALVDLERPETVVVLTAGLRLSDARARYLCARGLVAQKKNLGADKARVEELVKALREAALAESDPIVLGRVYEALAFPPNQTPSALDAYLAVFDKRIAYRKSSPLVTDAAELYAYEFFRNKPVASGLNSAQQQQLAVRLAALLRLDAERYQVANLPFDEADIVERCLDAIEEILVLLVGESKGGKIRDVLGSTGRTTPAAIQPEIAKWIGDAKSGEKGALNEAPWNVPVGGAS